MALGLVAWAGGNGCSQLESPHQSFGAAGGAGASSAPSQAAGTSGLTGGAGGAAGCWDPRGFDGVGCGTCAASDIVAFENACSEISCTPFPNGMRLSKLLPNGELPSLPDRPKASASDKEPAQNQPAKAPAGFACDDLGAQGRLVYVTGSSAARGYLEQIAQQLASRGVYLVYAATGSCSGVDAILNGTRTAADSGPATYWESASSSGKACDLPTSGAASDLAISDVFAQTCPGFELASLDDQGVRDVRGPIQTMIFAVPSNSRHSELSRQAAYFVFGFGKDGGVRDASGAPAWDDESLLMPRAPGSGTQALVAAAIGVPADRFVGPAYASSEEVAVALQEAGTDMDRAQRALGILAADHIESRNLRARIRALAFQDTRQGCAVYPDSTQASRDKRNVRDGHYPLWGPLHFLYRVDTRGNPIDAQKREVMLDIIGYLSGTKPLPSGLNLLDVYAENGLIPQCAMQVTRLQDGGNVQAFRSNTPCACSFEFKVTGSTACKSCASQGDCGAAETCSFGYCERG
ncbi:MAG TPA: hypothetical protein VFQ61_32350 [Polyangiaceae bacterium]|nr:hypothetical protein [Polyangiaceae bacterium]